MLSRQNATSIAYNPEQLKVFMAGICALILSVGLARFAYTPMLPIMRTHAGLSDLAGGWLATLNYLGYITGAAIAASITDLSLKFRLYRFALIIALITTTGMGITDNMYFWAILRFFSGLSSTAGLLLASGLILNWLIRNDHRPELGLHFTGIGLGVVVSGLAVAATADHFSWEHQWIILGIVGVGFFLPAWLWLPAPASIKSNTTKRSAPAPSNLWLNVFLAAYFCAGFGYVISATFIVAILEKLPLIAGKGSWVWVAIGITAVPSSFLWDRIASQSGPIKALLLAYGLQVISIFIAAISVDPGLNLLSAVLYGGTFVGIVSLTLTVIGRHFPDNPAKAMAKLTLSYGVAQIAAPAMSGYIATITGSYQGALLIAGVVMCLGMAMLVLLPNQTHTSQ